MNLLRRIGFTERMFIPICSLISFNALKTVHFNIHASIVLYKTHSSKINSYLGHEVFERDFENPLGSGAGVLQKQRHFTWV